MIITIFFTFSAFSRLFLVYRDLSQVCFRLLHGDDVSIRVIPVCYCNEVWYKEEGKEASKPAFLYTDTMMILHSARSA